MRRPFLFPLGMLGFALLAALAVMLLWNMILPNLFHVGEIGYWQALGILALSKILFGGYHGCSSRSCGPSRLHHMSSEDREKLRDHWRSRCGGDAEPPASDAK
ncbi:MAG: hypothetical protein KDB65_00875 [Calditrichaeota bacterium]|nr:hypothetical protein [Calditrichota bacterium]MCB9369230.1 hypothetical protein [Calditrichota bacterium]